MKDHKFWSTQPINGDDEGPIEIPTNIPTTPYELQNNNYFVDLTESNINEIYDFLYLNYAEDHSQNFRLNYSKNFILWQINNLKKREGYIIGVRNNSEKLIGFVHIREHDLFIKGKGVKAVSVNYLCLAKELRGKYYAPIIIKEATRRANLNGIYQAVFTGATILPQTFVAAKYYHRLLNVDELIEKDFCDPNIKEKLPVKYLYVTHKMRNNTVIASREDLVEAYELVVKKCRTFHIYEDHTLDDFIYNHKTQDDVVYSLVNKINNKVLSFVSFFIINTLVVNKDKVIKTAYLHYHAGINSLEMISDALAHAKDMGCELFNLLDFMDNHAFILPLGFREGDMNLNYYLFNYQVKNITKGDIHLSLA